VEARAYKVTAIDGESESWAYYIRHDSMTPAEQEIVAESNLRARAGGYELRREALAAAKLDANDIARAAEERVFPV
jgi:hypothetical protein